LLRESEKKMATAFIHEYEGVAASAAAPLPPAEQAFRDACKALENVGKSSAFALGGEIPITSLDPATGKIKEDTILPVVLRWDSVSAGGGTKLQLPVQAPMRLSCVS
jgi:hypothetical protein